VSLANDSDIVKRLLDLPLFHAGWVLWLLLALSVASVAIMIERAAFFRRHKVDVHGLRRDFDAALASKDYEAAARVLQPFDSLETNVVLFGLRKHAAGPDAVEDLMTGALPKEKERYDAQLDYLATLASNAPFVGLFGTVLGIIRAFKDLSLNVHQAATSVMAGVAEALVATAVGLLVAIPSLVAFNLFKGRVKVATNNAELLARTLLAHLKSLS
jgi:biopolymer transport protein ExbB/TolQ